MAETTLAALVVDDEEFFRDAIRDALGEVGIACETAASASEAAVAAENPRIGAVVLDLSLPDVSGPEVLRQLLARRPALRVIVLSSLAEQDDALEALRVGACDYLAKPLHDEELVLAVRRALAGYGIESGWDTLRQRLSVLEDHLSALSSLAAVTDPAERTGALSLRAVDAVSHVLGASKTSILLPGEEDGELRVAAANGSHLDPGQMDAVRVGEGVAGLAAAQGSGFTVEDVDSDARFAGCSSRERYRSRSLVVSPIPGVDGAAGVLCATDRDREAPFDEEDLVLLRILALQLAAWLVPAPAAPLADGEGDAMESDALDADADLAREICDAMTSEIEPGRMLECALRPVARSLPASPVSLYLIDNATGELVLEGQCGEAGSADRLRLPRNRGLAAAVLQTGYLVATDRPESDPRFDPAVDTPEDGEAAPLLCVPLRLRGKVLGLMRAFLREGAPASARSGELLAAALSAAVRNVLLYRSLLESIDEVAEARRESHGG